MFQLCHGIWHSRLRRGPPSVASQPATMTSPVELHSRPHEGPFVFLRLPLGPVGKLLFAEGLWRGSAANERFRARPALVNPHRG